MIGVLVNSSIRAISITNLIIFLLNKIEIKIKGGLDGYRI